MQSWCRQPLQSLPVLLCRSFVTPREMQKERNSASLAGTRLPPPRPYLRCLTPGAPRRRFPQPAPPGPARRAGRALGRGPGRPCRASVPPEAAPRTAAEAGAPRPPRATLPGRKPGAIAAPRAAAPRNPTAPSPSPRVDSRGGA